ncbi:MAG: nuclear transport factor 2 family protein [Patescibacteria group bacterium]
MRRLIAFLILSLAACSGPAIRPSSANSVQHEAVVVALLQLADSVFAAARNRDADAFATYFSERPDFRYLINTRVLPSRGSLRATFATMLANQQHFEPAWGGRHVQVVSPDVGILTGVFETVARRRDGSAWQARGVITFVAMRETQGWRVVNWHTTE